MTKSNSLWFPFTPMQTLDENPQLSIVRAEGNYLIDENGTSYLDGIASLWTNVHGHQHKKLNQAIIDQIHRVSHTTLLGLSSPPAEELAEELVKVTPKGLDHVFYSDSGSTAVEIALKQAFQYWQLIGQPQKQRFVHIDQAYHGDTLGAVAVGGIDVFHQIFGPLLLETLSIPCPTLFRHPKANTEEQALALALDSARNLFAAQHETIAAFILEPLIQGAGGMLTHPPGFLSGVRDLCTEFDILLIADEVATGFGRTGTLFACEQEDVTPDLMCIAKGITGGYLPLAATLSTTRIFNAFLGAREEGKTFFHGHTYTGNALACAAALANLEIFTEENTLETLQPKIDVLRKGLEHLAEQDSVGDIRQRGMMIGIEVVADSNKTAYPVNQQIGLRICMEARKHQVIIRNLGDVVVLMPPLSVSTAEIATLLDVVSKSIKTVCG